MTEQVAVLEAIFRDVERKHLSEDISMDAESASNQTISGVATLCSHAIANRPHLESQVAEWLCKGQGGSIQTIGLRRALLVNFSGKNGKNGLHITIKQLANPNRVFKVSIYQKPWTIR